MLTLHRAERSDTLASALADLMSMPLADPFAREVIAVPAKGVERWITQRLSATLGAVAPRTREVPPGDGIAANIEFPSPARLVNEALSAATGFGIDDDPWAPSKVLWTLLGVIDDSLDEPWCGVLARHLGPGADDYRAGRRYGTAAHLAELLRSYGAQRPAMLVDWANGRDTDGAGGQLDVDQCWQAELWRRLRERIGSPSPAERLEGACDRLRADPALVDLPARLSLFGPTRLSTDQLAVLAALGVNRDVHLWVPHPSPAMWSTLNSDAVPATRAQDMSALSVRNPLLASLSRDVRELQARLTGLECEVVHHEGRPAPATLLGRLQSDLAADRASTESAAADGSVQVHSCHGPARQVEVLRESLLHLFSDDETLEPRDILVMCPDVETYAPLIRAAFGQDVLGHPGHRLRVRLADRALHQTNPVLAVLATLLHLADARLTATQLLDLAAAQPVRRRFGFSDDDLESVRGWAVSAGARWGLGSRQRAAFGLDGFAQNTVGAAMDRILLGAAADESEGWLNLALPLDDVDSNDIDLTGRLAEFVDRLDVAVRGLAGPQTTTVWSTNLIRALDLLVDVAPADAWQLAQARRELAEALEFGGATVLGLADIRSMLASRLAGRPTRANFRTGELTVCTMVPMRSVPHRVVVMLGLDDEVFPRGSGVDGDNVLARTPLLGERDPRSEDRQLLLDAVMSAGEKLLLLYTGKDPVNGSHRAPAIPLVELLDAVRATAGAASYAGVVTEHPLQPFAASNFRPGTPFSFDRAALAGARSMQRPPVPVPALRSTTFEPLAANDGAPEDVQLADLIAFLANPTQGFLKQRLGLRIPELEEDIADALDLELNALVRWGVGQRMLAARLAGADLASVRDAEWRRGTLPPFELGRNAMASVVDKVEALVAVGTEVHAGPATTVDVDVDLGGRRLTGTVGGVHGEVIAGTGYSKLAAKHRLTAWVQLLAVAASDTTDRDWRAITIGRGSGRDPLARSTLIAPADARDRLARLVTLRDRGLCAPLPVGTKASAKYAALRYAGRSAELALTFAEKEWGGEFGESHDRHIEFMYGPASNLSVLTSEPADGDEPTRFGALAREIWDPLLASEKLETP